MVEATRCPRCDADVPSGASACPVCGSSLSGRAAPPKQRPIATAPSLLDAGPARRNVYEPDESSSRLTPLLLGAGVLAVVVLVGLVVIGVLNGADSSSDTANPLLPGGAIQVDRQVQDLGDGWWRLDIEDGAMGIDLPGPILRSRADLVVADFGDLPTALWGGGFGGTEVYGATVGERPGDWSERDDEFLEKVPFPVAPAMVETERIRSTLGDRPSVEIRGRGLGSFLLATTVLDGDRIVQLVVIDEDAAKAADRFARMQSSLTFGE